MVSVGVMIQRLEGLLGTKDITSKEEEFVRDMVNETGSGKATALLTGPQVKYIEGIFRKHFAG